jgi:hypothetical protein
MDMGIVLLLYLFSEVMCQFLMYTLLNFKNSLTTPPIERIKIVFLLLKHKITLMLLRRAHNFYVINNIHQSVTDVSQKVCCFSMGVSGNIFVYSLNYSICLHEGHSYQTILVASRIWEAENHI